MTKSYRAGELAPIPWAKIHPHYKAGILSLRAIAEQFGTSHQAIRKHAARHDWGERDLRPAIIERSDALVAKAAVAGPVPTTPVDNEQQVIEDNAQALAVIRMGHRKTTATARRVVDALIDQLALVVDAPELFGQLHMALDGDADAEMVDALRKMVELVGSASAQSVLLERLGKSLTMFVALERESYGLNSTPDGGDRPTAIIRDFTGRGDPDSPFEERRAAT